VRSLGFSSQEVQTSRVYRRDDSDALIAIPVFPDSKEVLPHHLVAVRMTLDNFGIADPLDFDAQLQTAS
jgi:hypothetical protein